MKTLKPLPHAVLDYTWAGTMMAAPWLFGFNKNRQATINSVASGAGILALSLVTKYPLGAVGLVSFPAHGVIEAAAGVATTTAPWLMGFSRNGRAKWTHLISGLSTLAVVAMTDYRAAQRAGGDRAASQAGRQNLEAGRGAGMAEQLHEQEERPEQARAAAVDLGPPTHFPEGVLE